MDKNINSNIKYSYEEIKIALLATFPISKTKLSAGQVQLVSKILGWLQHF